MGKTHPELHGVAEHYTHRSVALGSKARGAIAELTLVVSAPAQDLARGVAGAGASTTRLNLRDAAAQHVVTARGVDSAAVRSAEISVVALVGGHTCDARHANSITVGRLARAHDAARARVAGGRVDPRIVRGRCSVFRTSVHTAVLHGTVHPAVGPSFLTERGVGDEQ